MENQHPPIGTYPPDEAASNQQNIHWNPPPPPVEKPEKKVGTLTVAIGLIAVGLVMVLRLFFPGLDYQFIARLSPLLLIAYGAEVLLASAIHKDKQITYDWVGIVVSVILISVSLVAAAIPEIIVSERTNTAIQRRLRDELDAIGYQNLKAAGIEVAELDWYVEASYYSSWNESTSLADIDLDTDYLQVRIRFADDFADEQAFASACRQALDAMGVYAQNADYAIFYSKNYNDDNGYGQKDIGKPRFGLWLENNYQVNYSATQMAGEVKTDYWTYHYGWAAEEEFEEFLLDQQQNDYDEADAPDDFDDFDEPDDSDEDDYFDDAA